MPERTPRRKFLQRAAGIPAVAGLTNVMALAANDTADDGATESRLVVGVMGLMRGRALARWFAREPNVEVRYVCDADEDRVGLGIESLKKQGVAYEVKGTQDFRQLLDDPQLDALICAAPNHWHAPATILACQAGKHVYVEKPCSHNPWEGEAMVAVADRHRRVVQLGTQRRSSAGTRLAMQRIRGGAIGKAYLARAWYQSDRGSIGHGRAAPIPESLDYEIWQGPAPKRDYLDNVVHYNWHWRWHWGNGELGNNGIHTLDLCRWGLDVTCPTRVNSTGGRYAHEDDQETPDTQTVGFEFPEGKAIAWHGLSCNRHPHPFVTFYGTEGTLELDANGDFRLFDRADRPQESHTGSTSGEQEHIANFCRAVRNSNADLLNAPIHEGHLSTLLCHLGNIAHRTGRSLECDPKSGRILNDEQAMQLWKREYNPSWEPKV